MINHDHNSLIVRIRSTAVVNVCKLMHLQNEGLFETSPDGAMHPIDLHRGGLASLLADHRRTADFQPPVAGANFQSPRQLRPEAARRRESRPAAKSVPEDPRRASVSVMDDIFASVVATASSPTR